MKYCTLFFSKIRKILQKLSSAAVVIGALGVKAQNTHVISTGHLLDH